MDNNINPEILAPAGSKEALVAAVRCGADAVYLGLQEFNARKSAANFTRETLPEAVDYCHSHNVKVHLALNTLLYDGELPEAAEAVRFACGTGVDAIIVDDFGLVDIIRDAAPDMPLHGSTQMTVHTPHGVKFLAELGFQRAVLARELSFDELKAISDSSNIELEIFVHGALCMCVSGQCYLSSMLGGRSGNRGRCAQPCRLPFSVKGGTGYDLSLKDMSIIDRLPALAAAGISSFKIEGRMKRPEYVAAAVTACRMSLEGSDISDICSKLCDVFSRSGFTSGYLDGNLGRHMFGIRRHEDVKASARVLTELSHLYASERGSLPVAMSFSASPDKPCTLSASCLGHTATSVSEYICQKALNVPLTEEKACNSLRKSGGTQFTVSDITCTIGEGTSVPLSVINDLRRRVLDSLSEELSQKSAVAFHPENITYVPHRTGSDSPPLLSVRLSDASAALEADLSQVSQLIVPLETPDRILASLPYGDITVLEIPRVMFGREESVAEMLHHVSDLGFGSVMAHNIGAVRLALEHGMTVYGGFGLNVFNSQAAKFFTGRGLKELTLSFELPLVRARSIASRFPSSLIVYGRVPLMISRNCPAANGGGCSSCRHTLTDRKNIEFPVECRFGASELLNSRPIYLSDRMDSMSGFKRAILYFTDESPKQISDVINMYAGGLPPECEYTRGLYFRSVE